MAEHDDGNGRVTTRMLRATVEDTRELLRAELALVRQELHHGQQSIHDRLDQLAKQLEHRDKVAATRRQWVGNRANTVLDKVVAAGGIAAIAYIVQALIR